jgi:hypothetical protein
MWPHFEIASDRFRQVVRLQVAGLHRKAAGTGPVHRCPRGSDDCSPRPQAFGVTAEFTPRFPARGWLRGREWERITRWVYAAALSRTQFEELGAWQLVLPRTAAFSHLTAARLRGWWLPTPIAHPVFAAMLNADPRPRRPGLLVCRHTRPFPMNLVNGAPDHHGSRDDPRCCARPRCARSGYPR